MMDDMDWSADDNKGVIYRDRAPTADDYREAIADLQNALVAIETGDESKGCAVCEDSGHGVRHCHHNPLEAARAWVREQGKWRCFHCGYVALTEADALAHFGENEFQIASCLATTRAELAAAEANAISAYRMTEEVSIDATRLLEELAAKDAEIARWKSAHGSATRLVEEKDATIHQLHTLAKANNDLARHEATGRKEAVAELAAMRERADVLALQADEWEGKYAIASDMIHQLGENAAKAAGEYAEEVGRYRRELRVGDKVRVIGEYEADWLGIDAWITGINADHKGLNYTLGEQWPVPHRHMPGYQGMTDGFSEGDLARAALTEPTDG